MSRPVAARHGQNRDSKRLDDLRRGGDGAAVVAIRHMAGEKKQRDGGNELHQPDEAELERASGQRIHLPADRDRLHLQRDRGGNAHIEKAEKGGWRSSGTAAKLQRSLAKVIIVGPGFVAAHGRNAGVRNAA